MAVKIRLARGGAKKRPYYRIVVANSTAPRDGAFLEKIGTYDPMLGAEDKNRINIKSDRANYWLGQGAKPTDRVAIFLQKAGVELPNAVKKELELKLKSRKEKAPKKKAEA